MDASEFQSRLEAGLGGSDLWELRKETALYTTSAFSAVGLDMTSRADFVGGNGEAVRAMGALLEMAGELGSAATKMLSGNEHYAGSALVRQIVEIEYLTWTFKEDHESIAVWLNSSHEQRMKVFSPKQLRANSKGRFLFKDYQNHCEQGGHPVPRGISLLRGRNVGSAQLTLVDLLLHCWRTWDQFKTWLMKLDKTDEIGFPKAGLAISHRLNEWGRRDPIYNLACELYPERGRGR
jgi:hypothetical protein